MRRSLRSLSKQINISVPSLTLLELGILSFFVRMEGDRTHGDTIVRAKLEKWISQIKPPLEGDQEVRQTRKMLIIRFSENL